MSVEVFSAVIVRENRILLTQRSSTKDFPFTWECPGGKAEVDESAMEAISRELQEELGVVVISVGPPISRTQFKNLVVRSDRSDVWVSLLPVWIDEQEPNPKEGQGIGWFTADEMLRLSLAPANYRARFLLALRVGDEEKSK